jgi:cytochrome c oxidase subunit 3
MWLFHRFRLADVFGAADWLQLSARFKRLAHAVSFYPSIVFSSVMTFCLLSSSLTMVLAFRLRAAATKLRGAKMDPGDDLFRRRLYRAPLDRVEPLDTPKDCVHFLPAEHWVTRCLRRLTARRLRHCFGATFFTITGLHMFHVHRRIDLPGCRGVVAARVKKLKHEDVEISGLYWHFVDLVWMFVFPLIYIMSVDTIDSAGGHVLHNLCGFETIRRRAGHHG